VVVGLGLLVTGPLAALDRWEDSLAADFNRERRCGTP
jgi:hypothetical protein